MELSDQFSRVLEIAREAGQIILDIYNTDFDVEFKSDESPLTIADQKANAHIVQELLKTFPEANLITEETKNEVYEVRRKWQKVWIVDPLDGTKEFVKRNGEFTVNIALVENEEATFGVIYVPVTDVLYFAEEGKGAYKVENGSTQAITTKQQGEELVVVASRSHRSQAVDDFVANLDGSYKAVDYLAAGSSLKFCLVAEGKADIYPRFGPTMEWDIAAGSVIAKEAGASITRADNGEQLLFNKEDLLNPFFIVSAH